MCIYRGVREYALYKSTLPLPSPLLNISRNSKTNPNPNPNANLAIQVQQMIQHCVITDRQPTYVG